MNKFPILAVLGLFSVIYCQEQFFALQEPLIQSFPILKGGKGYVQIGTWRIGDVDGTHFSFSHASGFTSVIYRSDGTIHNGPRRDFGLWERTTESSARNVVIGEGYLEFNFVWRLGQTDRQHFSLTHISGWTAMIWRIDGTKHVGPRTDFTTWQSLIPGNTVLVGERFVQIGSWRLGCAESHHFSISNALSGYTADIYRSDGTTHPGPRTDFTLNHLSPVFDEKQLNWGDYPSSD